MALTGVLELFRNMWSETLLWYAREAIRQQNEQQQSDKKKKKKTSSSKKNKGPSKRLSVSESRKSGLGSSFSRFSWFMPSKSPPLSASAPHTLVPDPLELHPSSSASASASESESSDSDSDGEGEIESTACSSCSALYSFFRHRYSCRLCGLSFCDNCSQKRLEAGTILELSGSAENDESSNEQQRQAAKETHTPNSDDSSSDDSSTSSSSGTSAGAGEGDEEQRCCEICFAIVQAANGHFPAKNAQQQHKK